jgi:hypothetical protein
MYMWKRACGLIYCFGGNCSYDVGTYLPRFLLCQYHESTTDTKDLSFYSMPYTSDYNELDTQARNLPGQVYVHYVILCNYHLTLRSSSLSNPFCAIHSIAQPYQRSHSILQCESRIPAYLGAVSITTESTRNIEPFVFNHPSPLLEVRCLSLFTFILK